MQTLKIFGNIYCSAKLIRGVENQIIYLSVIYVLLGITAVVGNTLILIALHNETSLHQPSKLHQDFFSGFLTNTLKSITIFENHRIKQVE